MRKSLFVLLSTHPASFYHPPDNPEVDQRMSRYPDRCRLILNLLPSCLSSAAHLQAYYNLNWQPRSSLLYLLLQIRRSQTSSLNRLLSITVPFY
jgi:hypothetical protein